MRVLASAAPARDERRDVPLVPPLRRGVSTAPSAPRCRAGSPARLARSARDVIVAQSAVRGAAAARGRVRGRRGDRRSRCTATGGPSTRLYGSSLAGVVLGRLGDAARARGASPRRRRAHGLAVHEPVSCASSASSPPRTFRRTWTSSRSSCGARAAAGAAGRALRRRARAYKNVDGLAAAWRLAAPRVPEASLRIVGKGTRTDVVEALVARLPGARWTASCRRGEVAAALDAACVLVLPSRSEGMGARGRRGVLPRPRRRRHARRRDPRPRRRTA